MTCIVGIAERGIVFMGADSAGVGGLDIANRKDVKVFTNGEFVIGCTTSFRMIQLLQYKLSPPKRHPDVDVMRFMVTDFIEEMRKVFREGGFTTKDKDVETGGTFLVGHVPSMSEEKREKESAQLAQAVRNLRENLPALMELEALNAHLTRRKFLALVEEGFSEVQALELCKKP